MSTKPTETNMLAQLPGPALLELSEGAFRAQLAQEMQQARDEQVKIRRDAAKAIAAAEARFGDRVDAAVERIVRDSKNQHTKTRESLEELKVQVSDGHRRDLEHEIAREADATRRKALEDELDVVKAHLIRAEAASAQLAADVKIIDSRTTGNFPVVPRPALPSYEELVDSTVKHRLEEAHEQAKQNAAIAAKAADVGLEAKRVDNAVNAENKRLAGKTIAGVITVPVAIALIGLAGALLQRSCNVVPPDKHIPVIDSEKP